MTPERAGLEIAAAEAVRVASRQARLASLSEVLEDLARQGFNPEKPELTDESAAPDDTSRPAEAQVDSGQGFAGLVEQILHEHPEIESIDSLRGEPLYHAPRLLSRAFALILDRKASPLALLAEEVRSNSRDYPRPLPLELFESAPFGLSTQEIQETLRGLAASPDYQDISFAETACGSIFLFSSRYLTRQYALFLAEQAENQAANP